MRNINYFDKELSVEEYVKKEVCKKCRHSERCF